MATLIYAPGIRVYVKTGNGILDLSNDIVSFQLNLRENAVHTFSFKVQNAQRKYDGRLLPMDKIRVQLKRVNWLQNFTGYLNAGPVFQAWPGVLDLTANCTLKRPQFWYWDPTTTQANTMMTQALQIRDQQNIPQNSTEGDAGLSTLISTALNQVVQWPVDQIHIGEIPNRWFKFASQVGDLIEQDVAMYQALGGGFVAGGQSGNLRVNLPAGSYGNNSFNDKQVHNASIIYNTVKYTMKISDVSIVTMALMCSMQEASLLNTWSPAAPGSEAYTPNDGEQKPNYDSSGLFQQRLSIYGPIGNIMNPVSATQAFVNKLLFTIKGTPESIRGLGPTSYGATIQSVQGSAYPDRYQQWLPDAQAMIKTMDKLAGVNPSLAPTIPGFGFGGADIGSTNETSTGSMVAKVASNLIAAHQTKPILYDQGQRNAAQTPVADVKYLDCSSLVCWSYYGATGKTFPGTGSDGLTNVQGIYGQSRQIPIELAKFIQGAVLIIPPNDHIGVSLGDGTNHVAAHQAYDDPKRDVDISPIEGNGFTVGGLMPGIDYTGAATTQAAADQLKTILGKPTRIAPQLSNVIAPGEPGSIGTANDAFSTLINATTFNQDASGIGNTLGGNTALINDQPFLPWLQNVINSSMRSFCSAPNGDFIAWFPDYFGVWGTAGIMKIELVELQDFTVYWSDQQMVTHQFVLGNQGAGLLDQDSGTVGYAPTVAQDLLTLAQQTAGIATMDYPEIFKAIYDQVATKTFTKEFMARFGARPDVQQMPFISKGKPEFFMALYLFMQRWAAQFTASVPLTFMPEIFPGMLIQIPDFGFQAYVRGVQHQGSFGQNGSFTTTLDIAAPANIVSGERDDLLALLPIGGRPLV